MIDIYCYADPAALKWWTVNDEFMPEKVTLCHVKGDVAVWEKKFGDINVTFVGDLADGIDYLTPTISKSEGAVYNLAGQRMNGMAKGLNIVDGKKVMVK